MKIITPSIRPVKDYDGDQILLELDSAARLCYKSEGKINYNNLGNVIRSCIKNGHTSVLEHVSLSFNVVLDNGILREWTRHRIASYSVESTRYCDYSSKGGIKYIAPIEFEQDSAAYKIWKKSCEQDEATYNEMAELRCQPQERRSVLNFSVACEMRFTANLRSLRNLLSLRCAKTAHLHMRELCIPLLLYLKDLIPVVFDDIDYDHDFVDKYLGGDVKNYTKYVYLFPTLGTYDDILSAEKCKRMFIEYFDQKLDINITRNDIRDTRYLKYYDNCCEVALCCSVIQTTCDQKDLVVYLCIDNVYDVSSRLIDDKFSDVEAFNIMHTLKLILDEAVEITDEEFNKIEIPTYQTIKQLFTDNPDMYEEYLKYEEEKNNG